MERSCNDFVGMPVVSAERGEIAGTIEKMDFDLKKGAFAGLLMVRKGILARSEWVAREDIVLLGEQCVIARLPEAQRHARTRAAHLHMSQSQTRIFACDGQQIGYLGDWQMDDRTLKVTSLEVSRGLAWDAKQGRLRAKRFGCMEFSQDLVVFPEELAGILDNEHVE
nr:PRC-barrel domain-containing protein [Maliibacterium massiliense]